ncbi:GxxExxY protein [Acidisphaera sp. S103]|uniref:GxxExxY protein n=1 Tax=Acidisphaera sp. S103 TaxID=1747223 RepID=UPI001C2099A5
MKGMRGCGRRSPNGLLGVLFGLVNALDHGLVEKVYQNALAHEMRKSGCSGGGSWSFATR